MMKKILFLDDNEADRRIYKKKLDRRFEVLIEEIPESVEDYNKIITEKPEVILLDFDLSIPNKNNQKSCVSGVPLSIELRQRNPDIPIILFTKKSLFDIDKFSNIKNSLSCIDNVIFKTDLSSKSQKIFSEIENLASGYSTLQKKNLKSISELFEILKAPVVDFERLKQSIPRESLQDNSILSTAVAARWIRNILIKYPGILYEDIYAATLLGVSKKAFLNEDIQKFFSPAKYSGIFSAPEDRWWKSKLVDLAVSRMKNEEISLPLNIGFPKMWARIKKENLDVSKCNSSNTTPADYVCCLLKEPTTISNSILYPFDLRPDVMDKSRLSFKAIRESNDYNLDFFDLNQKEMIKQIRGKKR
jgi:CheY-like chemotaxis protein